jgi:molybdopterin-containing oxidoreductase family membrane subunit
VGVILGGFAQLYVLIIGGQAYPQLMFPEKEVASRFFDGVVAAYTPSLPELALGVGGTALALALTAVALKVLPFLPKSLADGEVDSAAA